MRLNLFILLISLLVFGPCMASDAAIESQPDECVGKSVVLLAKDMPSLDEKLKELKDAISKAKDPEAQEEALYAYHEYRDALFKSPEVLFKQFCPGARTLCTTVFPEMTSKKVDQFVNYIIDNANESLEFYFGKPVSDLGMFEIDVLLRELGILIDYFKENKGLLTRTRAYTRLKAFRLDYLFFKAYVILLKGRLAYSDVSSVELILKDIKQAIQTLAKTNYEQYYRKRLEMLDLAISKASEDICFSD